MLRVGAARAPQDVQATLAELTAWAAPRRWRARAGAHELLVCGGGALNGT
jgi:1,6-anhydro-N-acetylmuramate kinase